MSTNRLPLLALALVAALGLSIVACGGDENKDGKGGDEGEGGSDVSAEICDNGIDDDEDGDIDCADSDCATAERCDIGTGEECAKQSDCANGLVCVSNVCESSGQLDPEGNILKGAMMLRASVPNQYSVTYGRIGANGTFLVEFFYPLQHDGSTVDCRSLVEQGRSGLPIEGYNRVHRVVGLLESPKADEVASLFAGGVPVPEEGVAFVALARFYAARTLEGEPAGELATLGCVEGVVVPPGEFVDDDAHQASVTMGPICNTKDLACPGEKECNITYRCVNLNCGGDCTESNRKTCRTLDGENVCVDLCNSEGVCDRANHFCDTTPGEIPACLPL